MNTETVCLRQQSTKHFYMKFSRVALTLCQPFIRFLSFAMVLLIASSFACLHASQTLISSIFSVVVVVKTSFERKLEIWIFFSFSNFFFLEYINMMVSYDYGRKETYMPWKPIRYEYWTTLICIAYAMLTTLKSIHFVDMKRAWIRCWRQQQKKCLY